MNSKESMDHYIKDSHYIYVCNPWFGTFFIFPYCILGMSYSQLTFIFFRGLETTNQIYIYITGYTPVLYGFQVEFQHLKNGCTVPICTT